MIDCPPHQESKRVTYRWWYDADGESLPLPSKEHYFVLQNGTLVFSILRDTDVDFIKNNNGIFCRISAKVGVDRTSRDSKKIVIVKTTTGNAIFSLGNIISTLSGTKSLSASTLLSLSGYTMFFHVAPYPLLIIHKHPSMSFSILIS